MIIKTKCIREKLQLKRMLKETLAVKKKGTCQKAKGVGFDSEVQPHPVSEHKTSTAAGRWALSWRPVQI